MEGAIDRMRLLCRYWHLAAEAGPLEVGVGVQPEAQQWGQGGFVTQSSCLLAFGIALSLSQSCAGQVWAQGSCRVNASLMPRSKWVSIGGSTTSA